MSCFNPEKKRSVPKKVWKGFIFTLQKKLKSLETSKFRFDKTSQYRLQHHHLYHCHFKHFYQEANYGIHARNTVEPPLIEPDHAEYFDMERKIKKAVFATNDLKSDHEGCNKVEENAAKMENEDNEHEDDDDDDDTSFASSGATQQHRVDAIAEEFINKMKGLWKHENQKSDDQDRTQNWKEHRVDAIAEEFINKMRGRWKLEKQKSVEDYIQRWACLQEY
ncbi:unnamed protein product [Dovyalis caffra]|uniref:Uncharacterized protein n=1 Tax=Dovyalis caffra TaxID=77055 RepID=A0AAV1R9D6_9ROSI|nr:unnamed protein product [Dovyalis caffra]